MNKNWYTGDTGLFPLDYSIKRAIKYSWASHIERLMIQANIMNLCQINLPVFINGLWKCIQIHLNGLCIQMFMEWEYFVMEEYLQLNLIYVVQTIF